MNAYTILKPGDIVVAKVPFSNLEGMKIRPALVLGVPNCNEVWVAKITSKPHFTRHSVLLDSSMFFYDPYNPPKAHSEACISDLHTITKASISKVIGRVPPNVLAAARLKMLDIIGK